MTFRRVIGLNAVLLALCGVFLILIVRSLSAPVPTAPRRPAAVPADATAVPATASADRPARSEASPPSARPELATYSAIATKNLFSPSRTESAAGTPVASAGPPALKPVLHGVVVSETASIAFLEDPTTKRVTAHRIGDALPGGTVQSITADRVVLAGPGGALEVRLRDPSKPRPRAPSGTPGGAAPVRPEIPASAVPPVPPTGPPVSPTPVLPRPFSPNVLRRAPPPPLGTHPGAEPPPAPSQPGSIQVPPGPPAGAIPPSRQRGTPPQAAPSTDG